MKTAKRGYAVMVTLGRTVETLAYGACNEKLTLSRYRLEVISADRLVRTMTLSVLKLKVWPLYTCIICEFRLLLVYHDCAIQYCSNSESDIMNNGEAALGSETNVELADGGGGGLGGRGCNPPFPPIT